MKSVVFGLMAVLVVLGLSFASPARAAEPAVPFCACHSIMHRNCECDDYWTCPSKCPVVFTSAIAEAAADPSPPATGGEAKPGFFTRVKERVQKEEAKVKGFFAKVKERVQERRAERKASRAGPAQPVPKAVDSPKCVGGFCPVPVK